jgi:hypothetical protein
MEVNIKMLVEHCLSPNEYVYLYYLVNKMMLPINISIDTTKLEEKGFIKIAENKIVAREKAISLFQDSNVKQVLSREDQIAAIDKSSKALQDSVSTWIADWRDLFPRGIKTGGYPLRGTKSGCEKKMKQFIKANRGVTKEMIFKATKKYLDERALHRYQYTKMADYFINKDGSSMLEGYVEDVYLAMNTTDKGPQYDQATNNLADDI